MKVHSGVGHQVLPQRGKVDRKFRYAAVLYQRHVAEALTRGSHRDQPFLLWFFPAEFPSTGLVLILSTSEG